jgi:hypothetical protein
MNSPEKRWYLSRDGQQRGPFSDADVANFSQLGQLQTKDLIWRDGLSSWRAALTIFPAPEPAPVRVIASPIEPKQESVDDKPRRRESARRSGSGLTWTIGLIALTCSALIGAASGYVFKRYLANMELTVRSGNQ